MRVAAVLLALGADVAWNFAGAFWGFTVLALLVLWVALNQAHVATGSKAYATEQRLNAAMSRIPNPQTTPGSAGNVSYPINYNDDRIGATDQANTSGISNGNSGHPLGGAPTDHWHSIDHYHPISHGHIYGSLSTDFNALRQTCSDLVAAHNALVTKLQQANILQ